MGAERLCRWYVDETACAGADAVSEEATIIELIGVLAVDDGESRR